MLCAACGSDAWLASLQGYTGLQQELVLDMQRLWQRNLGRDDRIIADTSRWAAAAQLHAGALMSVAVPAREAAREKPLAAVRHAFVSLQ